MPRQPMAGHLVVAVHTETRPENLGAGRNAGAGIEGWTSVCEFQLPRHELLDFFESWAAADPGKTIVRVQ